MLNTGNQMDSFDWPEPCGDDLLRTQLARIEKPFHAVDRPARREAVSEVQSRLSEDSGYDITLAADGATRRHETGPRLWAYS
jgi:hypothetical protein